MSDLVISSPANPRLKALLGLRRRRARDEAGVTLVEGHEELALALAAGVRPRTVFVCPELYSPAGYAGTQAIGHQEDVVTALREQGVEIVRLSRTAFEKVAYREGPDGLLGVVATVDRGVDQLTLPRDPFLLVAEGVEKPGNLGAMLRSADAAGVDAVIAADPVTDWGNPNVVRASKGTVFSVQVAGDTTEATITWAQRHGVRLIVTTPETTVRYTDVDLTGSVAVVVGAEKHGLTSAFLEAGERVRIPMSGKANSLNVAAAAAVVLFEAVRQRSS